MGLPVGQPRYSISEYIRREQGAVDKHEYRAGDIRLMAGGSADHSLIIMNVSGELRNLLKGKPCHVYEGNLRIRVPRTILYTYPDASIICGPREVDANDPTGETIVNPRVLIEVLSPTTEAYDRGEKFDHYRNIVSLEEYLLVSQVTPRIESFFRQSDGTWLFTSASGLDTVAQLRCLGIALPLAEAYAGIRFPSP